MSRFEHVHWAAETSLALRPLVRSARLPHPTAPAPSSTSAFPCWPEKPGPEVSRMDVAAAPPSRRGGGGAGAGGGSRGGAAAQGRVGLHLLSLPQSDIHAHLAGSTRARALIPGVTNSSAAGGTRCSGPLSARRSVSGVFFLGDWVPSPQGCSGE